MISALTYSFVSLGVLTLIGILFHVEHERGRRFFPRFRERFDYVVFSVIHALHQVSRVISTIAVRQIIRYLFHTLLSRTLALLERWERSLRNLIRSNRTYARTIERERTERNKLEEVALHKMAVALSDEEKRRHKARSLEG